MLLFPLCRSYAGGALRARRLALAKVKFHHSRRNGVAQYGWRFAGDNFRRKHLCNITRGNCGVTTHHYRANIIAYVAAISGIATGDAEENVIDSSGTSAWRGSA